MSCCGQKRDEWQSQNEQAIVPSQTGDPFSMNPGVYFEYTGDSGLTVIGSVTQFRYRFNGKGDRQMIDSRDAAGMAAVPVLRNVMG